MICNQITDDGRVEIIMKHPLDPRSGQAIFYVIIEEENAQEDAEYGDTEKVRRRGKRFLASINPKSDSSKDVDKATSNRMAVEDRAANKIIKAAKVREIKGANGPGYDENGIYYASVSIDSVDDIKRLRDQFDGSGRTWPDVLYTEASGLMFWPQGVNGPRYGLESSNEQKNDLDEWLEEAEEEAKASRPARKPRKAPRRR